MLYRARQTDELSGSDAKSRKLKMILGTIACKQQKSAGDDESSEVRNRGYQWTHKMDKGPTKTLKKIHMSILTR